MYAFGWEYREFMQHPDRVCIWVRESDSDPLLWPYEPPVDPQQ